MERPVLQRKTVLTIVLGALAVLLVAGALVAFLLGQWLAPLREAAAPPPVPGEQQWSATPELPEAPPPATAEPDPAAENPAASVASAGATDPPPASGPGSASSPLAPPPGRPLAPTPQTPRELNQERFVEIAATIILSVARMEPSPEVLAALPVMVDGALREAGVSREDYEAYQRQVLADPARREQVAAAILERVDKQATPEMRVRAMSLVEGFYHSQRARESE